jgi:hypothetical protein
LVAVATCAIACSLASVAAIMSKRFMVSSHFYHWGWFVFVAARWWLHYG